MSKALRVLRKPTDVPLLIDPIKPSAQRAWKANFSDDPVLPDKSVWLGVSFRRNAADSHSLPPVVHVDDGGAGRAGIVNGRENVVDHDETVPSRRMLRIVAVDAPEMSAAVDRGHAREP